MVAGFGPREAPDVVEFGANDSARESSSLLGVLGFCILIRMCFTSSSSYCKVTFLEGSYRVSTPKSRRVCSVES